MEDSRTKYDELKQIKNPSDTWSTTLHSETSLKPNYYKGKDFDVIDVCNKFEMNFNLGNVMKYIVRAGKKDPEKHIEDLNKAMECLQREINFVKKNKI